MKKLNFRDKPSLINYVLNHPKAIGVVAGAGLQLLVAGKQLSAQELVGIYEVAATPFVYSAGHTIDNKTFILKNTPDVFASNTFEYAFGKDVKNKVVNGTYNLGIAVSSNNLLINKKNIPDKLFEQINLAMHLSKIFNTPVNINLGISPEFGNFYFNGITFQGSAKIKNSGTAGIISLNNEGKISSYQGIQEVSFGKRYTAGLRIFNTAANKFMDSYVTLHGFADLTKKDQYVFMPYASVSSTRSGLKKGNIDYNLGVFFKPLPGAKSKILKALKGTFVYAEVGFNKEGHTSGFLRLNKNIPYSKKEIKPKEAKPFRNKNFSKQHFRPK